MSRKKEVCKLHLAKSLSELNCTVKVDSNKNDPKTLLRSAVKIFESAEKFREDGDEEKSYVLYSRYYEVVMRAKNSPLAKDKKYVNSMINTKELKVAIEWAEKLSESLEKRYKMLKDEEETTKKLQLLNLQNENNGDDQGAINSNVEKEKSIPMSLSKVETSLKTTQPNSIECLDLYNYLTSKYSSMIIMDAREASDFNNSRITSPNCINIPAHLIKPGITGPKLGGSLPLESRNLWDKRGNVDRIILLDWFSASDSMSTEIKSLKDAIYKWDSTTKLKNEPVILTGGYDKWLMYYPTMTTDSRVKRPNKNGSVSPQMVTLNFDYPSEELDKAFIMSSEDAISSLDSSTVSAKSEEIVKPGPTKLLPNIDRTTKPKAALVTTQFEKVTSFSSKNITSDAIKNDLSAPKTELPIVSKIDSPVKSVKKPVVKRELKPKEVEENSVDVEANERLEMWNNITKYKNYVNEALLLEKEKWAKEKELGELRLRREMEAEENMKMELQKQEEELLSKISTMEDLQKRQETENKEVKEENEYLKRQIEELHKQSDEECKRLQEELAKNQRKDAERISLEKEIQKMRIDRIKKEAVKENALKKEKQESVENRAPLKPLNNLGPQVNGNKNTNFVKIKDADSIGNFNRSSKLSRAHSFHNISQISDNDDISSYREISNNALDISTQNRVIPSIDRKSKPSPTELSGTLNRNFMPVFGGMGQALTGLKNLGNTCYMNSVIQCLANTLPLVKYFRNGDYRNHVNRSRKLKGILVDEFAAIIQALYLGQYRSISPKDFRNVISQYDRTFESCEQQDPQEFLNCVMDNLHEDLQIKPTKNIDSAQFLKSLEDSTLPDEEIAIRSWEMYKMLHNSVITDMFQGQYRSTLKCLHCNKKAVKFDTFMFLSLPIPSSVNRCTLKDCLQLFLKEEKLTGGSKWKCPRCNELRDAVKKIDIWKLPPVLLIHFKRFYYEGMWKGKMQTYIDFPVVDNLDLHSFVKGKESKNMFKLYGVTNHSGTLDGGHCIAYCKNAQNNRWHKFDDQDVKEMQESDVKSSGAYILYYLTQSSYTSGFRLY